MDVGDPQAVGRKLRIERGQSRRIHHLPQGRLRAVQDEEAAGQRHQQPFTLLGPSVGGDPELELALALASQLLLDRKALLADAAIGWGQQQTLFAGLHVERVELAGQAALGAEQKGQQPVVRAEGERAGDGHSRRGVASDFFDVETGFYCMSMSDTPIILCHLASPYHQPSTWRRHHPTRPNPHPKDSEVFL